MLRAKYFVICGDCLFSFDFWLVASDGTYSTSGHVIVNLKDLNDNAPQISVIFIAPDSDAPNSGKLLFRRTRNLVFELMYSQLLKKLKNGAAGN